MRSRILASCAGLALFALLTAGAQAAAPAAAVQVSDGWIRWLPGSAPAAGYVTLTNTTPVPVTLTGASSTLFGSVSLHETRVDNGMSTMRELPAITIAPHGIVRFTPNSYHIMLMQPARALTPGEKVRVSLHFTGGQVIDVPFEVRKPDGGASEPAPMSSMPGMQH